MKRKSTNKNIMENKKNIILLMIFGLIIFTLYFLANFDNLSAPDSMKYGTVARNIVDGKGMINNSISIYRLNSFKKMGFSYVEGQPLHPIIASAFIYISGANDYAVALSSGLFYILTIPILYLLAKEIFDRRIAIVSTIIYIFSLNMLYYGTSGLSESLYIFLLIITCYQLYKSDSSHSLFLTGILLGISWLVRFNSIFFLIPILIYIFFICDKNRFANCLILLGGFVIATLPLYIRNYFLTSNPFFTIHTFSAGVNTTIFPEYSLHKSLTQVTSLNFILTYPSIFLKKYLSNLMGYYSEFMVRLTKPIVMSFFIVSLFHWYDDKKKNAIKLLILGMIIFQLLFVAIGVVRIRWFHIFVPFIIIFAVDSFFVAFDNLFIRNQIIKRVIAFVLIMILILPTTFTILFQDKRNNENYSWLKNFMEKNTSGDDVIASDISTQIGWYGNRKSIGLPDSFENIKQIDENYIEINAILLTNKNYLNPYNELSKEWKNILENLPGEINTYRLIDKYKNNETLALLYKKPTGS